MSEHRETKQYTNVLRLGFLVRQVMAVRKETLQMAIATLISQEPHSAVNVDDHFGSVTLVKRNNNDFIVLDEMNQRVGTVDASGNRINEPRPLPRRF